MTGDVQLEARPIRVVLCDDTAAFRVLVRTVLEGEADIEVVAEAADGADGADAVVRTRPDVLLLDLSMPRRDGIEALSSLQAAAPDTRVVVLSGVSPRLAEDRCRELGAVDYLEKGVSTTRIVTAVRAAAGVPAS